MSSIGAGETPGEGAQKSGCGGESPQIGEQVLTACNSRLHYGQHVPCGVYQGEVIYFCLPVCKHDFEKDPYTSCLAIRLAGRGMI